MQTLTMLRALNPALSSYDPLAPQPQQRMMQSVGLAASVAGLFFGNTVGLAASGAALFANLHSLAFPKMEFRSSLTQALPDQQTCLCAKRDNQAHTKLGYLWAVRIPDANPPVLKLPQPAHLAAGVATPAALAVVQGEPKLVERVQDWKLVAPDKKETPVTVKATPDGKTLDITAPDKLSPGTYALRGNWDWQPMPVEGEVHVYTLGDLHAVQPAPASQDRLLAGAGKTLFQLQGADFQFLQKLEYKDKQDPFATPLPLPFRLPRGPHAGPQDEVETEVDTKQLAPGEYALLLTQTDGKLHEAPLKVLPPRPAVTNLPLKANLGEQKQAMTLRGTGLDRLQRVECAQAEISLLKPSKDDTRRIAVHLAPTAKIGDKLTLQLFVQDVSQPIVLAEAVEVVGPRPHITGLQVSLPADLGVALRPGEIPSSPVSFALTVTRPGTTPRVLLDCTESSSVLQPLALRVGEQQPNARLQATASGLFLAVEPGRIGQTGCQLTATVEGEGQASSGPRLLGRVVRLPRLQQFQMTDEKAGDTSYYGVLKGQDLEAIEKVGWDAEHGVSIDGLPTASAGDNTPESLRIALPWPSPAPHAPLYVWLRGDTTGRLTTARP